MFQKFKQIKRLSEGEMTVELYHKFMTWYGFIPLEEFKKMPIPLILSLDEKINRDNKKMGGRKWSQNR